MVNARILGNTASIGRAKGSAMVHMSNSWQNIVQSHATNARRPISQICDPNEMF